MLYIYHCAQHLRVHFPQPTKPATLFHRLLSSSPTLAGGLKHPANHTRQENLVKFRRCTEVAILEAIFGALKQYSCFNFLLQLLSVFKHDFHRVAFKYDKRNGMIRPLLTVANNSFVLDLSSSPSSPGFH